MQFRLHDPNKKGEAVDKEQKQKGKWVLTNQLPLSNLQTEELFTFLVGNEETLKEVSKTDQEDTNRRLSEAYRLLLGEDMMTLLAGLYQQDPKLAKKYAKESLEKALGKRKGTSIGRSAQQVQIRMGRLRPECRRSIIDSKQHDTSA